MFLLFTLAFLCAYDGKQLMVEADSSISNSSPTFFEGEPFDNIIISGFRGFDWNTEIKWRSSSGTTEQPTLQWQSTSGEIWTVYNCTSTDGNCLLNHNAPVNTISGIRMTMDSTDESETLTKVVKVSINLMNIDLDFNNTKLIFNCNSGGSSLTYIKPIYVYDYCPVHYCNTSQVSTTVDIIPCTDHCIGLFQCEPPYMPNKHAAVCMGEGTYSRWWSTKEICPTCLLPPDDKSGRAAVDVNGGNTESASSKAIHIVIPFIGVGIICAIALVAHTVTNKSPITKKSKNKVSKETMMTV